MQYAYCTCSWTDLSHGEIWRNMLWAFPILQHFRIFIFSLGLLAQCYPLTFRHWMCDIWRFLNSEYVCRVIQTSFCKVLLSKNFVVLGLKFFKLRQSQVALQRVQQWKGSWFCHSQSLRGPEHPLHPVLAPTGRHWKTAFLPLATTPQSPTLSLRDSLHVFCCLYLWLGLSPPSP